MPKGSINKSFSLGALTLLVERQKEHPVCKKLDVICWWWRFGAFHVL